jgi:hypothetical protein
VASGVVGIDFVDEAIRRARVKAAERGLAVEYLVKDTLILADWGQRFASVKKQERMIPSVSPGSFLWQWSLRRQEDRLLE